MGPPGAVCFSPPFDPSVGSPLIDLALRRQRPYGLLRRTGEPRAATSTFTQLLSSGAVLYCVRYLFVANCILGLRQREKKGGEKNQKKKKKKMNGTYRKEHN